MRPPIKYTLIAILFTANCFAQMGEIRGRILEPGSKDGVPFASVAAITDSGILLNTTADIDGNYALKPLQPGKYNVKATCVGYNPGEKKNVIVWADKITFVNMDLSKGAELKEVMVMDYQIPLIDVGQTAIQKTVTYEELNIRGARSDGSSYYVDGIAVRGKKGKRDLLNNTGGVPAQYGDVTGSVVTVQKDNTEQYDRVIANKYFVASHNPLSTFSIDVDAASYSNMRRFIMGGNLPPENAVRIEEMINYFTYDYPEPSPEHPFSVTTEVSTCPWNEKHRLIHIGLKGRNLLTESLPENNLVFLIDVSGSMDNPAKLPLLKSSFRLLVEQLRKQDRVAIVVYAGNAGMVLPSTKGSEKEKILHAIDNLNAGGSTAGGADIQLAYKIAADNFIQDGNNRVILATDGDFNVGVSNDEELVKLIEEKRTGGVFLTVLGFGTGNYKDSKMEELADKGNGNYAYIDNIVEANKVFVKEMGATLNTIAKDVKLQIEFNPAHVKAYRLIGYENRVLADEDFNDDKKDAGELGSGHSVTALYEIIPASSDEKINDIDSLKYQSAQKTSSSSVSDEILTVKFRYKDPNGSQSKLIVHPLVDSQTIPSNTTDNFRFSAAVAACGMNLRHSEYTGSFGLKNAIDLAKKSKGADEEGYRAEFIKLMETAELLSRQSARVEK